MVRSQFIKNFLIFSGNPLKVIILLILLSITFSASSHTLEDFNRKSTRTNQTAKIGRASWRERV